MDRLKKIGRACAIAAFWLLIWQGLSALVASEFLLPSLFTTAKSLFALLAQSSFYVSTGMSLLRVICGYVSAVLLGILFGMLTAALPFADALLRPLRSIIKATPVASLILMVLLWLHTNVVPAFMAFLMVLPLVWTNIQEGIRSTDRELIEMAKLFRLSRRDIFREIYLPSVMPNLLAACATGLGFAWKASVAAEVLARTINSIGKNLVESKNYLETADMFAWTAVVVTLSIVLERLFLWLLRRAQRQKRWAGV